jgi:hypothetical protein
MKSRYLISLMLLCLVILSSATIKVEIENCFISFSTPTNLTFTKSDRLPETSEKFRKIKVDSGEVEITRIDGYRILYNNNKNVPFVNLKIELSDKKSFEFDKTAIIENLKYLNTHSTGMETKDLIELKSNGYKVLGFSRSTIETGSVLGTFVLFSDNGEIVYFYFNNLKPEFRHFATIEEYKKLRNKFIDEYTKHLKSCK